MSTSDTSSGRQELSEDTYARAALTYIAEPLDAELHRLVRLFGPVATWKAINAELPYAISNEDAIRKAMPRWRARLASVPSRDGIARHVDAGIRLVCPGDAEWPEQLQDLGDRKPYALWLRGNADLRFSSTRSVAIVGSRAATAYGSYVAADLAGSIAAEGWTILSGAAFGIDAAAHQGALGADGVTVAVLACGVNLPYPVGHAELLDAIAARGVIVSEYPPGTHASRLRFLARSRLIAALATATLVIEAGARSGSMHAARQAHDLGRPLMAVPGPITSEQSVGCHALIREWQATLVTSAAEVIECLSAQGAG